MKHYIYGAGNFGRKLYSYFKENSICIIDGFVQSERSNKTLIDGLKVFEIEELDGKDSFFFIAIDNNDVVSEIRGRLELNGYYTEDWSGFVRENLNYSRDYFCNICGRSISGFSSGGIKQELFEKHHIIGGGYRSNCVCKRCGCIDRTRWLYYVLVNHTDVFKDKSILHFAPEREIVRLLRCSSNGYISADINPGQTDIMVDITDIQFKEKTFDYVIANHVMEHVDNEKKAMSELKRVIKPEGKIILSFPICTDCDTYENPAIVTEEERLREYGQGDHVRLYGRNYKERLSKYALRIKTYSPVNYFSEKDIQRFGFIRDDIVMICEKK